MNFDYASWAKETRELVAKYTVMTPMLDMLLNMVVRHSTLGEIEEAELLKQDIEKMLHDVYRASLADLVSMKVPSPEECNGDIVIGRIFQGRNYLHEFLMPIKDFNRHVAIFASAGHGKTTLLINILHQLLEHDINFLAFDFKQDFRHLKHLPIIILRWNWLRINPFRPPDGVDEFQWLSLVCNLFAHVYGWFHSSKNYLFEFVNEQYQKNKDSGFASLQKVKEAIESTQEREYERNRMKTVVLNRLSTLLAVCHKVFDCAEGFPVHEFLKYPVVIEMDGCEPDEANFLISFFLLYIFEYRKAQQHRASLEHAIVFDEAHRIFYRQSEYRETETELGSSVVNQIPRIIRDYNEGLMFATQEPSQINNSVMANTDLKIVGYLGNGNDIEAIKRAFQLNDEDTKIVKRLKVGQFIVEKSGINDGEAFLLEGYDYPFEKKVKDEELKERMKDFVAKMQSEPKPAVNNMVDAIQLPNISEKASKILEHAGSHPLRNISQRYKLLNMHPKEGKIAIKELLDKKLLVVKPIQLSVGRPSIYLEPTELGKLWLEKNKVDISAWKDYVGNVGLEHRVYQWLIANALKKLGYNVKKEHTIENKRFDVHAENANQQLGIEVCISPKMNFSEAAKSSEQLDEVIFVCKDMDVIKLMQKEMASLDIKNPKFKFVVAYRYLNDLYSYLSNSENNENNSSNDSLSENNSDSNVKKGSKDGDA